MSQLSQSAATEEMLTAMGAKIPKEKRSDAKGPNTREKNCTCEFCPTHKNKYVSLMRHWRYVPTYNEKGEIANKPSNCARLAALRFQETKDPKYNWKSLSVESKNTPIAGNVGLKKAITALLRAGIIVDKAAASLVEKVNAQYPPKQSGDSISEAGDSVNVDEFEE